MISRNGLHRTRNHRGLEVKVHIDVQPYDVVVAIAIRTFRLTSHPAALPGAQSCLGIG